MNRKGFTLIELLAVILILGIIALIAIPTVSSVVEQSRVQAAEASMREYIKAVENKMMMMELAGTPLENRIYTVEELNVLGLDIKGDIPTTGEILITGQIVKEASIKVKDYAVSYDADKEELVTSKSVKYNDGTALYFNPETGKKCNNYKEENSQNENKEGCMKWYAFQDSEFNTVVTMILDHNTTDKITWNGLGDTTNGPSSDFLKQLKSDTSNWFGIEDRTDSFSFSNIGAEEQKNNYTINYSGYKARLLTAAEVISITNLTSVNLATSDEKTQYYLENNSYKTPTLSEGEAKYKWLFDYTMNCKSYGCDYENEITKGYWLAETVAYSSERAWKIYYKGSLAPYDGNVKTGTFGIRPVITIPKNILE